MFLINDRVFAVLSLAALAAAISFDEPAPTPVVNEYSSDGWTPKPTGDPFVELMRRDQPNFCGYLTGNAASAVTCSAGELCGYDTILDWFGCCTGTSITDCGVATACVESAGINSCLADPSCADDPLALFCTAAARPSCGVLWSTIGIASVFHFVCDADGATLQVEATTTGAGSPASGSAAASSFQDTVLVPVSSFTVKPQTSQITQFRKTSSASASTPSSSSSPSAQTSSTTPATTSRASVSVQSAVTLSTSSGSGAAATGAAIVGAAGGVAGLLLLLA
ncbi:hypothetical protein K432DRAFT_442312 [Lepidopterella palustris CBS 459.81]|uniref:Extracellular membrane protein CFEM domain-containing protein n=1 Tax=Lepidopterella palustris CBS 459.81 TaxID=1314670 RepID=A0A8E2ECN0_9PEZI|nr:hypothetical protein K432DRAFT_442312 [Lepidopterella palustris CBS 459.81]